MTLTLIEFCSLVQMVVTVSNNIPPDDQLRVKIMQYIRANYPEAAAVLDAGKVRLDPMEGIQQ